MASAFDIISKRLLQMERKLLNTYKVGLLIQLTFTDVQEGQALDQLTRLQEMINYLSIVEKIFSDEEWKNMGPLLSLQQSEADEMVSGDIIGEFDEDIQQNFQDLTNLQILNIFSDDHLYEEIIQKWTLYPRQIGHFLWRLHYILGEIIIAIQNQLFREGLLENCLLLQFQDVSQLANIIMFSEKKEDINKVKYKICVYYEFGPAQMMQILDIYGNILKMWKEPLDLTQCYSEQFNNQDKNTYDKKLQIETKSLESDRLQIGVQTELNQTKDAEVQANILLAQQNKIKPSAQMPIIAPIMPLAFQSPQLHATNTHYYIAEPVYHSKLEKPVYSPLNHSSQMFNNLAFSNVQPYLPRTSPSPTRRGRGRGTRGMGTKARGGKKMQNPRFSPPDMAFMRDEKFANPQARVSPNQMISFRNYEEQLSNKRNKLNKIEEEKYLQNQFYRNQRLNKQQQKARKIQDKLKRIQSPFDAPGVFAAELDKKKPKIQTSDNKKNTSNFIMPSTENKQYQHKKFNQQLSNSHLFSKRETQKQRNNFPVHYFHKPTTPKQIVQLDIEQKQKHGKCLSSHTEEKKEMWSLKQEELLMRVYGERPDFTECEKALRYQFGESQKWYAKNVQSKIMRITMKVFKKFANLKTTNENIVRFRKNFGFIVNKCQGPMRGRIFQSILEIYKTMLNMSEEKRQIISKKIIEINKICQMERGRKR